MKKRKVTILYKYIHQYRRLFYGLLRERLDSMRTEQYVIYGQLNPNDEKLMSAVGVLKDSK
jgi:hypothetical protein